MTIDVQDMVTGYLKQHGYDGLYDPHGQCACELGDLGPCGEIRDSCVAGYKKTCDCGEGCDFHIGPRKAGGAA